jgi:tetratricopeptide (TPR) repeat protein
LLYLDAINNNPEHSQAYSNLGLLYQKMGKKAEGLFANAKALALSLGDPVVQSSSYYNMARIHEDAGEWKKALENYQAAQTARPQEAYAKGIARMNKKLGGH